MNNECNSIYQKTLNTIRNAEKCKPKCIAFIGPTGPTGPSVITDFADYFALMPPDNATTVAPGADVNFPQDGEISGTSITRLSSNTFNLVEIGSYQIFFKLALMRQDNLN